MTSIKHLDLKSVPCPVNVVKIKLSLEKLSINEKLVVELDKGEPEEMVLKNLKEKRNFKSSLFTNDDQLYFFGKISKIETYEGNLNDSNICFIKKS